MKNRECRPPPPPGGGPSSILDSSFSILAFRRRGRLNNLALLTTMIAVRIVPSPHFMADRATELMLRVKAGDRAAFEEIFRLYQKPLANYLFRLTANRARSEDLLQDTFLRLWKAAPTYEPSAKVSTYIFRIAHNLFLNDAARR